MGFASVLYHSVAKRTSTFVLAIGISAFVFERGKITMLLSFTETPQRLWHPPLHHSYANKLTICNIAGFDTAIDYVWESHNKGKLWKDIKHKYESEE